MERIFRLRIEKLPEGVYLGTSDDVQGLVVQANTVAELIEYAADAAKMLQELRSELGFPEPEGQPVPDRFDMPVAYAA